MLKNILHLTSILLHERADFDATIPWEEEDILEICVRNTLKIPSTTRLKQYFEDEISSISAIATLCSNDAREWTRFHNRLVKEDEEYAHMKKFSTDEVNSIKDISFVQHKILAFEVQNGINDIPDFRSFLKKRVFLETPDGALQKKTPTTDIEKPKSDIQPIIIQGLPKIKEFNSTGTDTEEETHYNVNYGFCDDYGANEIAIESTKHALCGCSGFLKSKLTNQFFKPTLIFECTAHNEKLCTIGRSKAINLCKTIPLPRKGLEHQCAAPAAKMCGALSTYGANIEHTSTALRSVGFAVGNEKMRAVVDAYAQSTEEEHAEQQVKIEEAEMKEKKTCLSLDASFSQVRNAQYCNTAALDTKRATSKEKGSGEIRRLVILDKKEEHCASQNMEAIATEQILDHYAENGKVIHFFSTDESTEIKPMLKNKAEQQKEILGHKMIVQNDGFHRRKNNKKERKKRFKDPRIQSQKVTAVLENVKKEGLQQIGTQLYMDIDFSARQGKKELIGLLDPTIRSVDNSYYLVVGAKKLRMRMFQDGELKEKHAIQNEEKRMKIAEICREALKSNDIDEENIDDAIQSCVYLDFELVGSALLDKIKKHQVSAMILSEKKVRGRVAKNQSGDMTLNLKLQLIASDEIRWKNVKDLKKAREINIDAKLDEEAYYHRIMNKKLIIFDEKDEQDSVIQRLLKREDVVCLKAKDVEKNLKEHFQSSYRGSKWIEIVDFGVNRVLAKEFPILNATLVTKESPDGEIQGQTLLGKYDTHEYYCTDKVWCAEDIVDEKEVQKAAKKLHEALVGFAAHYRTDEAKKKYPALDTKEAEKELKEFEKYIKEEWPLDVCERFCLCVRTTIVESFFSTRLLFVPKNLKFPVIYRARMKACGMKWNTNHISDIYEAVFGKEGIEYRQNWMGNIHVKVVDKFGVRDYIERRGRPKKVSEEEEIGKKKNQTAKQKVEKKKKGKKKVEKKKKATKKVEKKKKDKKKTKGKKKAEKKVNVKQKQEAKKTQKLKKKKKEGKKAQKAGQKGSKGKGKKRKVRENSDNANKRKKVNRNV